MVGMPIPKEAKDALEKTATIAEDLSEIRKILEQLLELEKEKQK